MVVILNFLATIMECLASFFKNRSVPSFSVSTFDLEAMFYIRQTLFPNVATLCDWLLEKILLILQETEADMQKASLIKFNFNPFMHLFKPIRFDATKRNAWHKSIINEKKYFFIEVSYNRLSESIRRFQRWFVWLEWHLYGWIDIHFSIFISCTFANAKCTRHLSCVKHGDDDSCFAFYAFCEYFYCKFSTIIQDLQSVDILKSNHSQSVGL